MKKLTIDTTSLSLTVAVRIGAKGRYYRRPDTTRVSEKSTLGGLWRRIRNVLHSRHDKNSIATLDPTCLFKNAHIRGSSSSPVIERMIVGMMDANYISEHLSSLKQEMRDLRIINARYWSRSEHSALDKSARALHQERLLHIKRELSDMMRRCAQ